LKKECYFSIVDVSALQMDQVSYDGVRNYWKLLKMPSPKDGKYYNRSVAEVVKVEYFAEKDVPLALEKAKYIIRKCTDNDFDLPEEVL